jgi:hypothetical protein
MLALVLDKWVDGNKGLYREITSDLVGLHHNGILELDQYISAIP